MARRGENIRKRKDKRWEGRYIIEYDTFGKAIYKSIYGHSYSEVKEKLRDIRGKQVAPHVKMNVKELSVEWLEFMKISLKSSSYTKYYDTVYKHIIPQLGHCKICKLSLPIINKYIQYLYTNGRLDKKGGLSAKSIQDIFCILRLIINYAVKQNYMENFNLEHVILPRQEQHEFNLLTHKEQEQLTAYIMNNINIENIGTLLSLYTGIRLGELCALKWCDIDFETGILKITKTLQRIKNLDDNIQKTKVIVTAPKSKNSTREIPLQSFLIDLLKNTKAKYQCSEEAFLLTGNQRFIEPRLYQNKFANYLKDANIAYINFHAMRHTFATRAIEKSVDVKTLSELLGHSNVKFTLERYVHSSFETKKLGMEKIVSSY